MKKLIITEEEKNSILKMHLSEQTLSQGLKSLTDKASNDLKKETQKQLNKAKGGAKLNNSKGGTNTPKPTTTSNSATNTNFDPKKYLVGKTVNLYKDKENKNLLVGGCKITSFNVEGNNTVYLTFDKFTNKIPFNFDCANKTFSNSNLSYVLYNTRLADFLFPKFCARSSGGVVVPRADFSSLDTDLGSDMA